MENKIVENKKEMAVQPKNITDIVQGKVNTMTENKELFMPENYSPDNALKAAWLTLQEVEDKNHNKALEVCTQASIANSLLDMVVQGLNPAKKQCYFVVYGKKLVLMRSYMGTVAVVKRFSDVTNVVANVIYKGDTFKYTIDPLTGLKHITAHEQDFGNVSNDKIVGAYAVLTRKDDEPYVEIMTYDQIKASWNMGNSRGGSPAHKNFAEEMAKKTVINRACKMFVNTSDDSSVLADAFNRTTEAEHGKDERSYKNEVIIDIDENEIETAKTETANTIFGDFVPEQEAEQIEMKEGEADAGTDER